MSIKARGMNRSLRIISLCFHIHTTFDKFFHFAYVPLPVVSFSDTYFRTTLYHLVGPVNYGCPLLSKLYSPTYSRALPKRLYAGTVLAVERKNSWCRFASFLKTELLQSTELSESKEIRTNECTVSIITRNYSENTNMMGRGSGVSRAKSLPLGTPNSWLLLPVDTHVRYICSSCCFSTNARMGKVLSIN